LKSLKEIINLKFLDNLSAFFNNLEHKDYNSNFKTVKEYQQYLKYFYRKDKIKNLI